MLAKSGTPKGANLALVSLSNETSACAPGLVRPIALRTPNFHATVTGFGCPLRSSGPQLLEVIAPAPDNAARSIKLGLVPKTPDANTSGLERFIPKKLQLSLGVVMFSCEVGAYF